MPETLPRPDDRDSGAERGDAIGDTIRRCLEARSHIIASSPVDEVEVIVVSDGSTDRTEEIAKSFEEVKVLVFEVNRGYGAAIKCGWEHGRGDLLAFLDGDGTCDPNFFADLCTALEEQGRTSPSGRGWGPTARCRSFGRWATRSSRGCWARSASSS